MESYVIEHGAEHVLTIGRGGGQFDGLGNGSAQRTSVQWIAGQYVLTSTGGH